jgi:hypothetical protein
MSIQVGTTELLGSAPGPKVSTSASISARDVRLRVWASSRHDSANQANLGSLTHEARTRYDLFRVSVLQRSPRGPTCP